MRFPRTTTILLLAAALIVTAIVYWPGLTGGWVFDDFPNIVDNPAIRITHATSTLGAWVNAALSSPSSFLHRPLASLTFAANWYFGEGNPWPFKLTNVLIHLLNGVLLYGMLRELLRVASRHPSAEGRRRRTAAHGGSVTDPASDEQCTPAPPGVEEICIDEAAATRLALAVTAAWLLLPINLLGVLYVVQRMESLCQVFVLAGLWAYLYGRRVMLTASDAAGQQRGFSIATAGIVLGAGIGVLAKESAVLLPAFAFLAEALVMRFRRSVSPRPFVVPGLINRQNPESGFEDTGKRFGEPGMDSGFRAARGPGTTSEERDSGFSVERGPGMTREEGDSGFSAARNPGMANEKGGAGEGPTTDSDSLLPQAGQGKKSFDKRIGWLFVITLFVPAILGFAWLLRAALRPASWAGRTFTLGQRLLTEPRVLVDYLHWTLLPDPGTLSLYHDEIVTSTGLFTPWTTLPSIALLAALIAIAVWLRNRLPLVALGIGWFFASQLLTATIVPLELVYEQRMYFGSIGVLLAVFSLLLGLRNRIRLPLARGTVIALLLLLYASVTYLRAQEWSNPLRLAIAEANRHPTSARANYEAGRLLLIASDYQPSPALTQSWVYLRRAAAIPGSSSLPEQAMIMITDHGHRGDDTALWRAMIRKLGTQPTSQEDISALISLTNCFGNGICEFDLDWLKRAYAAALSRPHPIPRLLGAYADFQRDQLHDDAAAMEYLARAVAGEPGEAAYREDLAALYAKHGKTELAIEQIDALRRMNAFGRLDRQIAALEQMAEHPISDPSSGTVHP